MCEVPTNVFKSLVVEIRPRIQSVNVFAKLKNNCNTDVKVKVNLLKNSFQLIVDNEVVNVNLNNITPVINSLSLDKVANDVIVFKFVTSNAYGSFKSELLQCPKDLHHDSKLYETFLSRGKCYSLKCINCTNSLSGDVYFTRVLPLPSGVTDPFEWFCHPNCSNSSLNVNPKITDIFYNHCYAHVNSNIVKNTKLVNKIIICNKCRCWIGIKRNANTTRLWFNTVGVIHGSSYYRTTALNDVWISIKDILKHNVLSTVKLMFICESALDRIDFVLLWIVDRKLSLLMGIFDDGKNSQELNKLQMSQTDVAKVLFKHQKNKTTLVENWLKDSSVSTISVSKPMIHALTTHLLKYNTLFSEEYNHSNGYLISYLCMY